MGFGDGEDRGRNIRRRTEKGENMPVPQEILKLVERFDAQREAYQSGKYNEAQIRAEFIDPLFKALGWDIHNEQGYACLLQLRG